MTTVNRLASGERCAGALIGMALIAQAALSLPTTLRGKFVVWSGILDGFGLRGDETSLDLGCGRGAVLVATARRLPQGRAHGVDLWRSIDQSGNAPEVTESNAAAEEVAGRVELHPGDRHQAMNVSRHTDLWCSHV